MAFVIFDDLTPFAESLDEAKAQEMIADAEALAMLAAPCLATDPTELSAGQQAAVKAVLRGAILRWNDAGSGALTQESMGNYSQSQDTRQARKGMFWPSEIVQLQNICGESMGGTAYSLDTTPTSATAGHQDYCSVNFGASYCSCGYVLTAGLYYP